MTKLLDIEGTTTSIAFVYDTLFPYARAKVGAFLSARWDDPAVQEDVEALRSLAAEDAAAGREVPAIAPPDADVDTQIASATANVLAQMDTDRKTTALKSLQGKIWKDGYATGELRGHVFDDVAPALARWKDAGERIYIYSSGSVAAQKLLFGTSEAGDLMPWLDGYFDTTTGPKKEAASYAAIAEAVGDAPADVVFVTDNLNEAKAAHAAGMQVRLSVRPGNPPVEAHPFTEITSFDAIP